MNMNDSNNAAVMVAVQMITTVLEKGFALAENNAQRRHAEAMYGLETARISATAEARYKNAMASEIENRISESK